MFIVDLFIGVICAIIGALIVSPIVYAIYTKIDNKRQDEEWKEYKAYIHKRVRGR